MVKDGQKTLEQSAAELDALKKCALVGFLREQLGKPFQYGVNSGATGDKVFDCSSLVQGGYRRLGLELARTSVNQATYYGRPVEQDEPYEPGDILFFSGEYGYYNPQFPMGIGHCATYIGEGRVIHTRAWFDEEGVEHGEVIQETVEEVLKRRAGMVDREDDLVIAKRVFEGNTYYHEGQAKPMPDLPAIGRVE
ncbi:MAG: C40 family peptidase [Candidatus Levybacteria bacterium]|nr:C40 family peptidase [Candidatus Levybacteria bacterium]